MVLGQVGTREQFRDRDDVHGHQQSVLSRSMQKKRNMFELPRGMWSKECPEYGRLRVSAIRTLVMQPQKLGGIAYANVLREHQFRSWGLRVPCSFHSISTHVLQESELLSHGDDFMSGRTQGNQLKWLEEVTDKTLRVESTQ